MQGGMRTAYEYDNAGNLLTDGRARYTYDALNRTERVETFDSHVQVNRYDPEDLRHELEEDGKLVRYIFRGDEVVAEETEGNIIRLIRGTELLASDADHARTYYHYASDEMGSITHVVTGQGKETAEDGQGNESATGIEIPETSVLNHYEYDAWGNLAVCEETVENRFKFNGQRYDHITRQYYLRARYYNPVVARFTQEDTYRGDGLNLYAYCRNNPVRYVDPSGHWCDQMEQVYQGLLKKEGLTADTVDPDTQLRLMAEAANQVRGKTNTLDHTSELPEPVIGEQLLLSGSVEGEIDVGLSRRGEAERKLAEAAQGSRTEGIFIGKDGDVPVYQSQRQLVDSILDAGAQYVGNTRNGDGQIYHMSTPNGSMEIRIMQQKPGQTNSYLDNRTITVRLGSVGQGTGEYTYGNGARISGSVPKSDRKAIGHTHGRTP